MSSQFPFNPTPSAPVLIHRGAQGEMARDDQQPLSLQLCQSVGESCGAEGIGADLLTVEGRIAFGIDMGNRICHGGDVGVRKQRPLIPALTPRDGHDSEG